MQLLTPLPPVVPDGAARTMREAAAILDGYPGSAARHLAVVLRMNADGAETAGVPVDELSIEGQTLEVARDVIAAHIASRLDGA